MPGRYDHFRTHWRSRRLRGHDYAAAGWYFVTVCTDGRRLLFGEVRDGVMGLNEVGCLVWDRWAEIPRHHPRARLGAFVVMPNHVHGLLGLSEGEVPVAEGPRRDAEPCVLRSPPAGTLGAVVRSFKAGVTRAARAVDPGFAWQPRYHDHVVRSADALAKIEAYIEANPATWARDRFHPGRP